MIKGIFKDNSLLSKILIFIGLLMLGFGLSTTLGMISAKFIFGLDVFSNPLLLSNFSNIEVVEALKFMQLLHAIGIFVLPVLLFAYLSSDNWREYLSFNSSPTAFFVLITIAVMFVALPIINVMVELNANMKLPDYLHSIEQWMREKEDSAEIITESFLIMNNSWSFIYNLLIIGIIPAIGEELLFRGFLQNQLTKKLGNYHAAIWIAAFLFSAMHLQFYGFLPRFLLGAMFGYLFVWSGNLWIPILAHFINNAGAVSVQYIFGQDYAEEHIDSFGTNSNDWLFLLISFVLLTVLLQKGWRLYNLRQ